MWVTLKETGGKEDREVMFNLNHVFQIEPHHTGKGSVLHLVLPTQDRVRLVYVRENLDDIYAMTR